MSPASPDRYSPLPWIIVCLGIVCLVAGVSDLVDANRDPEVPKPVTLQDILDGKVGPKDYVEVRDYRVCSNYVKSWNRGGRILDDRLWCTGLVAGLSTRGPSDCTRPRVMYKPQNSWAAEPYLEELQKRGVLRGRLSKDVGLSAFEKDQIARTYPQLDWSGCLALYENPPPHTSDEIRRGMIFGGVMLALGLPFTSPGRRALSWLKQRVVKKSDRRSSG